MRGYIRKRGNKFEISVFLGRDQRTGKQLRKWKSFSTRREAEDRLASMLAHLGEGVPVAPSKIRLEQYLENWLRDYVNGRVRETTRAIYTYAVRHYITPDLGIFPLSRLTPMAIEEWLTKLQYRKLSPATVHQAFRVLREALNQAVIWNLLPRSPAATVKAPRVPTKEMRVWDEEQVRLFLAEAKRSSDYYPLYLTAILTGLRQGELLALRWDDIDWIFGRLSVKKTLVRMKREVIIREPKSKNAKRTVALPPVVQEELRTLRDRRGDAGLIFCQDDGKPLHAHNVTQRDFRQVIRNAKVPRIRFHDLRHVHATLLLRQGVNPKVVQEQLGHSRVNITLDTYSHVLPGLQEEATIRLAERLLGK